MSENIPLTLVGGSIWEPEREQETSFEGGRTQKERLTNPYVNSLYKELSKHYSRISDATHYENFNEGRRLYFKGKDEPLTKKDGKLRKFSKLESILGINKLHDLGFDVPKGPTAQQTVALNKAEEEMPSMSDIAKADDIELQEITENASRSIENLSQQLEAEDLPM